MSGEKGSYRSLYLVLLFAVLLGLALYGAIVRYQFQYQPQRERLQNCISVLTQDRAKAETYEAHIQEFEAEISRVEEQVRDLRIRIPVDPDPQPFLKEFNEIVVRYNVRVEDQRTVQHPKDMFTETEVTVQLSGSEEDLQSVLKQTQELQRFVKPGETSVTGNTARATLFVYSMPGRTREASAFKNACADAQSWPSAWPFSSPLDATKKDIARKRSELEKHAASVDRVHHLEQFRNERQSLKAVLDWLAEGSLAAPQQRKQ